MNDDRNAASGSCARMPLDRAEEPVAAPPPLHARAAARDRRAAARGRSRARRWRARAWSRPAGRAPRSGRGRGAGPAARPSAARRSSRRSSGASEPGSPASRPYQARSCATSTISATPPSTSDADLGLDRLRRARPLLAPERRDGAERARAVAALGDLHVGPRHRRRRRGGSSSRSRTPVGLRRGSRQRRPTGAERAFAREPDDRVDLGQRGGELVAVALGHAAGDHELRARLAASADERQDGVDRLLACRLDERARVDDDQVGVVGAARRACRPSARRDATTLSESTAFFGQPSVSM